MKSRVYDPVKLGIKSQLLKVSFSGLCDPGKPKLKPIWEVTGKKCIHLIASAKQGFVLSGIMRDFKKYTSSTIIKAISNNVYESRRNWMLWIFKKAGEKNSNNKNFQFWRQDNHPEKLMSNKFKDQKLEYIHNNPVESKVK